MMRPLTLTLPLLLILAACNKPAETPATNDSAPASATPASAGTAPPEAGGETAPPPAQTTAKDNLVPGKDYELVENGQPLQPLDGKVEVVEVFAYPCGHCAAFNPLVESWKKKLPADVRFNAVPLPSSDNDPAARVYYAAETTGQLDKVHQAMFDAIHLKRALRPNATSQDILDYLGKQGVDTQLLGEAMNSFAMTARLGQGYQFAQRSGVTGTPTLVVNGKYRVLGRSHEEQLQIANGLIAKERAAGAQ
ncbi:thiol:disulfide interchange protein DsbA/DsbL [Lysobacter pythonis]|uniref:Thiol:disulfide interchange protein DsbA n=1 Tax=Solilutibacter pythonis TaxID=2483112 RepID=A0A3M2HCX7_9GAMM|nr:thiol:disulfide interchange protein DsbA/DsbL [Lysobacter pythonis]RMH87551.1 thiol:disulfide interchange protein DsbA/DsbL [Lysobacter pythonis]